MVVNTVSHYDPLVLTERARHWLSPVPMALNDLAHLINSHLATGELQAVFKLLDLGVYGYVIDRTD